LIFGVKIHQIRIVSKLLPTLMIGVVLMTYFKR